MPTFLLAVGGEGHSTLFPEASMMNERFSIRGPQTREDPKTVHLLRSSHTWGHHKKELLKVVTHIRHERRTD